MSTNILLIDLSSIGHAMWHVCANEPDPNAASIKTVERIRALASGQPHVAICLDSPPYFRTDLAPDYKAKRDKDNNAAISHQLAIAADTLKADGFPVWAVKGFEADDVIATATRKSMMNAVSAADAIRLGDDILNPSVTIASADKDLLQLVSDRVQIKSLKDGSLIGPDEVFEKFGVTSHQIVDYLSLVGDSSDNVKGAEGIGSVKARKLLESFGNLDDMYRALDETPSRFANGTIASLREFQPRMALTRDLIRLRTDVPLPFDEVFKRRIPYGVEVFGGVEAERRSVEDCPQCFSPDCNCTCATCEYARQNRIRTGETPNETRRKSIAAALAQGRTMTHEHAGELRQDAPEAQAATDPRQVPPAQELVRPAGQQEVQRDAADAPHPPDGQGRHAVTLRDATNATVGPIVPREPDIISAAPVEWERQLEPRSIGQAKQVAADLFASRMFSAYGNAPAVLSTIMAGRELGFQTMASLRAIHVIEGKPSLSSGAIHALVLNSGKAEYFRCSERTPARATFVTKRKGDPEPISLSFTIEEGRQAWNGKRDDKGEPDTKSWASSGWGRNPADMLVARALTKLARLVYPDITHGLYAPEEMG